MSKSLVKLGFSFVLLAAVFWQIDGKSFVQSISHTSLPLFIGATFILFTLFLLPACAQSLLFKECGFSLSPFKIYSINLTSMFYSLAVPGDVASATARFLKFSKSHQKDNGQKGDLKSAILVVMTVDRLLNMLGLILPLPLLILITKLPVYSKGLFVLSLLVSLLIALLLLLGACAPWEKLISFVIRHHRLGFLKDLLIGMSDHYKKIPAKTLILSLAVLTGYQVACFGIVDYLLSLSLGLQISWIQFGAIAAAIRFVRLIPVTLAGIGVRESLYPLLLTPFGVPFEIAMTLGLLGTAQVLITGIVGGGMEAKGHF